MGLPRTSHVLLLPYNGRTSNLASNKRATAGPTGAPAELERMTTRSVAVASLLMLAACAPGAQTVPYMRSGTPLRTVNATGAGKITHVIYIVQENRSFDNLFQGYPNADTVPQGMNSGGQTITLQPSSLKNVYIIEHSAYAMFAACNGTGSEPGTNCRMN